MEGDKREMPTRTKEEEQALDEKIARIQRKNEEILRRQKEIEEDKRMAEQQNAIVKLRPSTTNVSRERTPALKPSNREIRPDFTEDLPEPPVQRSSRGSFRGRVGGERFRGQGDWKTSGGPPPDPKSFLYDDERDGPPKDNLDQRREQDRSRRDERDNRDDYRRGGREFQRGRRRGGGEYRGERGRRGGGRTASGRNEEEEWRAERMRIDEARIQRQRAADGKWRREWDNDKMFQESSDEPRPEGRRLNPSFQEKWTPSSQHHGQVNISPNNSVRHSTRGGSPRGGRGRGRLDQAELEMPLEKFQAEVLQGQPSPVGKLRGGFGSGENFQRPHSGGVVASPSCPASHHEDFKLDATRSVACVGNTVKISIPNVGAAQSTPKSQRQSHEARGRLRSQTSYSSQSDDDSPRDKGHRGGRRQRNQKVQKGQHREHFEAKPSTSGDTSSAEAATEILPVQNKPPLPPFRSEPKALVEAKDPVEVKDGDESWEDVTTSGTESMGEDLSSVNSSTLRKSVVNTMVISGGKQSDVSVTDPIQSVEFSQNQPVEECVKNSYEEYLNQLEIKAEVQKNLDGGVVPTDQELSLEQHQLPTFENTSFDSISLDTSDIILLTDTSLEDAPVPEKSQLITTHADEAKCIINEEVNINIIELVTEKESNDERYKPKESELVTEKDKSNTSFESKESANNLSPHSKEDDEETNEKGKLKLDDQGGQKSSEVETKLSESDNVVVAADIQVSDNNLAFVKTKESDSSIKGSMGIIAPSSEEDIVK